MKISGIIKQINFDDIDDDFFAETFAQKDIIKSFAHEDAIPNPLKTLPSDYMWYLENHGSRTVRNMEYRVNINNTTCLILPFHRCESPQQAWLQYCRTTGMGSYSSYIGEGEFVLAKKFLPFSTEDDGQMLVMDIQDNVGSIWQYPSKSVCREYNILYKPTLIAKSFTVFLASLKTSYSFKSKLTKDGFKEMQSASNVWKKGTLTTNEIFYKTINDYEEKNNLNYFTFKTTQEFLQILNKTPEEITINTSRTVELFFLNFSWKIKNIKDLKESIHKASNLKSDLQLKRKNSTITNLTHHTNTEYSYIGDKHNLYSCNVNSTINGLKSKETFILYKNPKNQLLSLVKRIKIEIEDLKIKDIGTFAYDSYWSLKQAKKIKWSGAKAIIHLNHDQEDFTEGYYDFIRQTINDISLKEKLEKSIFDNYQKNDYPEFLAMDKQTKEEWSSAYPKLQKPSEIWQLLGIIFDIHFVGNETFDLLFEYAPDPEHGLSLSIKNDKISINH